MPDAVRLAVPEDAAALLSVYAPYVMNSSVTFEYEVPTEQEFRARIEEVLRFYPYYVLERDGRIVGYAYAHAFHERKAYQWVCETSIYIRIDCRRTGCATRLYRALLTALRAQGLCEAIAILACPNAPSERLHESLGFRLIGTFPQAGYKLDAWHDVKWYGLALQPRAEHPAPPRPFSSLSAQERGLD